MTAIDNKGYRDCTTQDELANGKHATYQVIVSNMILDTRDRD